RSEERRYLRIDLVAGKRQPIAARSGDILGKGEDRDALLLGELTEAAVEQRRLHRRAARRVDRYRDRAEVPEPERPVERWTMAQQRHGAAPLSRPDHSLEAHDGAHRRRIAQPL